MIYLEDDTDTLRRRAHIGFPRHADGLCGRSRGLFSRGFARSFFTMDFSIVWQDVGTDIFSVVLWAILFKLDVDGPLAVAGGPFRHPLSVGFSSHNSAPSEPKDRR